ncbi:MAG TPA: hypothetical protein ENJ09_01940 [Planctomycetes bacterium]|nr:hypothetical protein [Planctomycetota bacterium]
MARRGKPEGNKRQRERDKRRKKEEKALRKKMRKEGTLGVDVDGEAEPGLGDGPVESAVEESAGESPPTPPEGSILDPERGETREG